MSLRQIVADAMTAIVDRILGESEPRLRLKRGDRLVVTRSVRADSGGVVLRGSKVEFTGIVDDKGRAQIEIKDLPDYRWSPTASLPYGPGFILFINVDNLSHEEL